PCRRGDDLRLGDTDRGTRMSHTFSTGRGARRRSRLVRRWVASSAGAALVLTGSLAAGVSAGAAPPTPAEVLAAVSADKIQPDVATQLEEAGRATVLIRFADRPD